MFIFKLWVIDCIIEGIFLIFEKEVIVFLIFLIMIIVIIVYDGKKVDMVGFIKDYLVFF